MAMTTRSAGPLLHDNSGWAQKLAIEEVSRLQHAGDGVIVLGGERGLGRDCFVQVWIERDINRIDDLEPGGSQRLDHLLFDHLDPGMQSRRVRRGWIDMSESLKVVERIEQFGHELG